MNRLQDTVFYNGLDTSIISGSGSNGQWLLQAEKKKEEEKKKKEEELYIPYSYYFVLPFSFVCFLPEIWNKNDC